jgi:transposase-like protein
MLNFKGMRFPIDVILVCIRWYAAYPLSYRGSVALLIKQRNFPRLGLRDCTSGRAANGKGICRR